MSKGTIFCDDHEFVASDEFPSCPHCDLMTDHFYMRDTSVSEEKVIEYEVMIEELGNKNWKSKPWWYRALFRLERLIHTGRLK